MTVNLGVDLHKTQFTVCVPSGAKRAFEVYPTTGDGYAAFLSRVNPWLLAGTKVRAGVESTGNTRYFKAVMEKAGVAVTVINTLKFKVVNESVKKTDRRDAAVIAGFLEKGMLPESRLCSPTSEQIRRLLKVRWTLVRAVVVIKNQIHALLTALGMSDTKASLQSKKGRRRALERLAEQENGPVAEPLFDTIERLEEDIKRLEGELERITRGDQVVSLLLTIPGCGNICAWTIRAYTDDIKRFSSAKKYASYAGLAPRVQSSNQTIRYGKITKRGPGELRMALVQVVMGMRRSKKKTSAWRLMERYEEMKEAKGSGRTVVAAARKVAVYVWTILRRGESFNERLMLRQGPPGGEGPAEGGEASACGT